MMDQIYTRMWKIKFDAYKKNGNAEDLAKAKELGQKRITAGKEYLRISSSILPAMYLWWSYLDFIKIQIRVFKDFEETKKLAEFLYFDLAKEARPGLGNFVEKNAIPRKCLRDEKSFTKKLIQLLK